MGQKTKQQPFGVRILVGSLCMLFKWHLLPQHWLVNFSVAIRLITCSAMIKEQQLHCTLSSPILSALLVPDFLSPLPISSHTFKILPVFLPVSQSLTRCLSFLLGPCLVFVILISGILESSLWRLVQRTHHRISWDLGIFSLLYLSVDQYFLVYLILDCLPPTKM